MLAIWSLVPLPFPNPAWTSGSSQFTYCWSLAWRILSISLLVCEMSAIVQLFEHSLALPFFEIGMKTDLFQSCGHCWVFQICWHIECSTCTASSFMIASSGQNIGASATFISLSNEYSGLISFRVDWFDLCDQGTLKSLLQHHNSKASILWHKRHIVTHICSFYVHNFRLSQMKEIQPWAPLI